MLLLAVASGLAVYSAATPPRADLVVWCFAPTHANTYREPIPATRPGEKEMPSLLEQFRLATGKTARVDLIVSRALDIRLVSLFMSDTRGPAVPDLCEIEIGAVGSFFRPPVDQVGLLPLNDYLDKSGQGGRILASRLAVWSKIDPRNGRQIIFGIPNDVHPITITYRKDLFDAAGIALAAAVTWPQLQEKCLAYQRWRDGHGGHNTRTLELGTSSTEHLIALLLQRHINVVDNANRVHFDDPRVADTVAFYAQMVAGKNAIAGDVPSWQGMWAKALAAGEVSAILTPDWRAGYLRDPDVAPDLAGKVRMMALPVFDAGDAPTSTWGGTMAGIPRNCAHPDDAWKLLELLYLSPQGEAARLAAKSGIIPPLPDAWENPLYHQADAYFGGQKVNELYIALARQLPQRYVTPFSVQAQYSLTLVLHRAIGYIEARGAAGLRDACAGWLGQAQRDLQQRIDFARFDE